jgi:hypothetical protein
MTAGNWTPPLDFRERSSGNPKKTNHKGRIGTNLSSSPLYPLVTSVVSSVSSHSVEQISKLQEELVLLQDHLVILLQATEQFGFCAV